jgi:hypothetical protein
MTNTLDSRMRGNDNHGWELVILDSKVDSASEARPSAGLPGDTLMSTAVVLSRQGRGDYLFLFEYN